MDDKEYYHFTNWDMKNIDKSKIYSTPNDLSNYWKNKLRKEYARDWYVQNKGLFESQYILGGSLKTGNNANDSKIKELSKELNIQLKYSTELLKEYIFDEVRYLNYPNKPTRKRCIFLFDTSISPVEYGKKIGFDIAKYNLIKIQPISPIHDLHRANYSLLNINFSDYEGIKNNAGLYWGSSIQADNDISSEVLYEGTYTITEIL